MGVKRSWLSVDARPLKRWATLMPRKLNGDGYEAGPQPVHLSCNHTLVFRAPYPKLDDELWCKYCNTLVTVLSVADTYGITCAPCHLGRRYGTDLDGARRAASRHVLRMPTHTVEIRKAGKLVERVTNAGGTEALPFAQVLSKRAAQVRDSQAQLRKATARPIDKDATTSSVRDATPTAHVPQEER